MEGSIIKILDMKNFLSHFSIIIMAVVMMACQGEDVKAASSTNNNSSNKTLIVYYSYTNNTEQIVDDLKMMIHADVIEVEPVNKNLDYAANGYAIGTEQLNKIKSNPNDESSYPAIDPVTVDMSKYNTVIIATPLWWSQMASNMQTFLFRYGKEMAGKNVGLIVSSHSSGISGVEADAKRLVP
ncbi:MAG: NAD(P)H-dependent oxidoreductase, partial [Prevotella sp.]|nr:NAD(P)H-dependent oxidoreductase [Candidatus Equicola stercoris]